jgi:hypothetical protein
MGTLTYDPNTIPKEKLLRIHVGEGVQAAAEFDQHQLEGHFDGLTITSGPDSDPGRLTFHGTREQLFGVLYVIESCPLFFGDCGNELETISAKSACKRTAARIRRELKLAPHEKVPVPAWAERSAS